MPIYAIGDIHGCKKSFQLLLDKIQLTKQDTLVLLGDYIDRGPDSKGVLDLIFELQEQGYHVQCIQGNHEQILLEAAEGGPDEHLRFISAGGKATMDSFGVKHAKQIKNKYLKFMADLPHYLEIGPYIFVHGGLNFAHQNPLEATEDMAWARYWYDDINYDWLGTRWIIHGHTPVPWFETQAQANELKAGQGQVVNLDTGCVYDQRQNMGRLTALELEKCQLISVPNQDV